jgi:ribosomal protein S18 acetylase RimI-like enzyme
MEDTTHSRVLPRAQLHCLSPTHTPPSLTQVLELVARKRAMQGVVLTVQKANVVALRFYASMKYHIDESSPSQCDDLDCSYEIMSKLWEP